VLLLLLGLPLYLGDLKFTQRDLSLELSVLFLQTQLLSLCRLKFTFEPFFFRLVCACAKLTQLLHPCQVCCDELILFLESLHLSFVLLDGTFTLGLELLLLFKQGCFLGLSRLCIRLKNLILLLELFALFVKPRLFLSLLRADI